MGIASINPTTGEKLQVFAALTDEAIAAKIALAQQTFADYRQTSFEQRSQWLQAAAEALEQRQDHLGRLMTLEMGKPLKSAIAEVKKCAWVCRFYAENAATFLADESAETDASQSYVRYLPLGIVLAVMPWNFPFWQVFRFAAPALMAGNVGLLKHASNVPQCALAIEEIFQQAGFPAGAFQTLLIGADQVEAIVKDARVKAATLTGSEAAGASLASIAGAEIKKTVLELGGSDPFIVLPSADIDTAVETAVTARMLNNGQSCIAAKRFIVHTAIADEFTAQLIEKFRALKTGDPLADDTDLGPLATPAILHDIDQQVQACVQAGAKALVGGDIAALQAQLPDSLKKGNFYPATLLSQIPPHTPAAEEEFFGPVALLFCVDNLDAAIELANSTPLGLGASAWTQDEAERDRLINELEAGAVFINGLVKSDPRLPFGGIKRSGYGRELGHHGIQEFVNIKTVWVK
ncbi:NAD-dependent succinate-semialdehyde dehydrogenase [Almyronema epifaneia]|uniref:NAD-dependent succinate-semialdehyde dehydrogenase n=1 Tax=Almyronema epifaneia S1 TaxID=2991925 RepID=A0ABW6ID27_9CYAN